MGKTCRDCEHFAAKSLGPGSNIWGLCLKAAGPDLDAEDGRGTGVFRWGDKTCCDFKPRKELKIHANEE